MAELSQKRPFQLSLLLRTIGRGAVIDRTGLAPRYRQPAPIENVLPDSISFDFR